MEATKGFIVEFVEIWSDVFDVRMAFDIRVVVEFALFDVLEQALEVVVAFGMKEESEIDCFFFIVDSNNIEDRGIKWGRDTRLAEERVAEALVYAVAVTGAKVCHVRVVCGSNVNRGGIGSMVSLVGSSVLGFLVGGTEDTEDILCTGEERKLILASCKVWSTDWRTDSGELSLLNGEGFEDAACGVEMVGCHTSGGLAFGSRGGSNATAKSGSFIR